MSPSGIEVFVFKGSKFLGSRCFSQSSIIVGRGRDAQLRLQDAAVEDRHAVVRMEGADLVIADNSSSGVFVNGEKTRIRRISSMDEVSIGPFRIKFSALGQDEGFASDTGSQPAQGHEGGGEDDGVTRVKRVDLSSSRDSAERRPKAEARQPEGGFDAAPTTGRPAVRRPSGSISRGKAAPQETFREQPTRTGRRGPSRSAEEDLDEEDEQLATKQAPNPLRSRSGAGSAQPSSQRRKASREESVDDVDAEADGEELPPGDEPEPRQLEPESDDEDDEDEEANWIEPFSLLENVVRERFKTPMETEPFSVVEVIHYADNEIIDLLRANPGESIRIGSDRFEMLKLDEEGQAQLYFRKDFSGTLVSRGKARPLKAFCTEKYLFDRDEGVFAVVLQESDYAQVLRGGQGHLVRFVKPPVMPKARNRIALTAGAIQAALASMAFHALLGVMFAVIAPEAGLAVENDSERFAKVALKDVALEKAMEEPKVEAKKDDTPPPEAPKDAPAPEAPKVVKKAKMDRAPRVASNVPLSGKQKERAQRKAVAGVMSALENLKPAGATPGRSDLKALASNISAVRSPGGAGNFKISGAIGKLGAGDGLRLVGGMGGGGGKDTKVGSQLLAGGTGVGRIAAIEGTGTRVRARVAKAPTRAVSTSGGQCDRAVIQRVVGEHMAAVQNCYERALLTSPGLNGKIVFDWTIGPGGGVTGARQAQSTMASPAVASCVLAMIRTWNFAPCPIGGPVVVRYPFVFRPQGF